MKQVLGILFLLFFYSCRSKVLISREEFSKVTFGMGPNEVKEVLGEPHSIRANVDSGFSYFYIIKKSLLDDDRGHIYFNKKSQVYFLHYGDVD
jgi:hypothetical protein